MRRKSGASMSASGEIFMPGMLVRHPTRPQWGLGQVISAIGPKVSVTFEHAGKQVINITIVDLLPVFEE